MPYPPRPPTPQAVLAALKRAGFNRIEPMSGPVSLEEHTAGYKVRKARDQLGAVEVLWEPSSLDLRPDSIARRQLWLLRYANALLLAGFRSQVTEKGEKLIVYARRA